METDRRGGRRARWLVWLGVTLLSAVAGGAAWGFLRVGSWLVVEDALEPAQAIVVLSGRMPARAREAAELYRQGYAARVWVIHPAGAAEELKPMGIDYVGEEFYNEKVLMHLAVPADAIRVLEPPAINTEEEVERISEELRREGGEKVIVVTSKPHTRRVRAIWKAKAGASLRLMVRYPAQDDYDGEHWWRHTQDALDVEREVLGLLNVWAGFPVRPAEHR